MSVPADDELAAIALAYLAVTRRDGGSASAEPSRWRLAARLALNDVRGARFAARSASRWNAAGRLDG
jgi:hypothetical protein